MRARAHVSRSPRVNLNVPPVITLKRLHIHPYSRYPVKRDTSSTRQFRRNSHHHYRRPPTPPPPPPPPNNNNTTTTISGSTRAPPPPPPLQQRQQRRHRPPQTRRPPRTTNIDATVRRRGKSARPQGGKANRGRSVLIAFPRCMGVASRAHGDPHNQLSVAITSPWAAVQCHRDIEGETDQPAGARCCSSRTSREVVYAHASLRVLRSPEDHTTHAREERREKEEEGKRVR